jgi:hypothetical protein
MNKLLILVAALGLAFFTFSGPTSAGTTSTVAKCCCKECKCEKCECKCKDCKECCKDACKCCTGGGGGCCK